MGKESFSNLAPTTILGIDGINNLGTTYLTETKEFMFQSDILQSTFAKVHLKTVSVLKIPAKNACPVRLGTAQ
jgi:hypothetical protein